MAEHGSALGDVLDLLDARSTLALKQAQEDAAVFGAQALCDRAAFRRELARAARTMYAGRAARLVHPASLIELIARAPHATDDAVAGAVRPAPGSRRSGSGSPTPTSG